MARRRRSAGRTDAQQLGHDRGVKTQVPMPLHRIHQRGNQGLPPLAAQPIGRFPQDDQNLPNRLVVQLLARRPRVRHFYVTKPPQTCSVLRDNSHANEQAELI
jgi:hypothetical protein